MLEHDHQNSSPNSRTRISAMVASGPLLELLDQIRKEREQLEEIAPGSEAVIQAYERFYNRLWEAISEANGQQVLLSTEEVADQLGYSTSHVQHLCAHPEKRPFEARKVNGSWRIDARSLPGTKDGTGPGDEPTEPPLALQA